MVSFLKFSEYVASRSLEENQRAHAFDSALAEFKGRFGNKGESIIKANGYPTVAAFLSNKDPDKWSKLRIPGQDNYMDA